MLVKMNIYAQSHLSELCARSSLAAAVPTLRQVYTSTLVFCDLAPPLLVSDEINVQDGRNMKMMQCDAKPFGNSVDFIDTSF